jgi:hypothetical protein
MKWKKLGKIFDPTAHKLSNDCSEYAQSPQSLVFDDFVRIYFSTRKRDLKNGKYLSHISFVDFDKSLREIIHISKETVIELGVLGSFDEHGIFPMNVLRHNDKIFAYTGGWNRKVSVTVDGSIGFAVSHNNGLSFEKIGEGPVLTSSLHEPFLIGDPFVQKYENTFHMWYIYGLKWLRQTGSSVPDRVYKIGHAVSDDGINWNKEENQLIADKLNSEECQALPTVIYINDTYRMIFCYREATGFKNDRKRGYRLGCAFSKDLIHWNRDDENIGIDLSDDDWDSEMMCYPHLFQVDNKIYLLYNGNEFGRFGFGLAVLEN